HFANRFWGRRLSARHIKGAVDDAIQEEYICSRSVPGELQSGPCFWFGTKFAFCLRHRSDHFLGRFEFAVHHSQKVLKESFCLISVKHGLSPFEILLRSNPSTIRAIARLCSGLIKPTVIVGLGGFQPAPESLQQHADDGSNEIPLQGADDERYSYSER